MKSQNPETFTELFAPRFWLGLHLVTVVEIRIKNSCLLQGGREQSALEGVVAAETLFEFGTLFSRKFWLQALFSVISSRVTNELLHDRLSFLMIENDVKNRE